MTDLDRTLKSRDITLPTKVHLVKAMVFPVVMDGRETIKKADGCWTTKKAECSRIDAFELWCWRCETIKKAECSRIDAFELWCWRRLLRVP